MPKQDGFLVDRVEGFRQMHRVVDRIMAALSTPTPATQEDRAMSEQLKPCPFCGGDAESYDDPVMADNWWIRCTVCYCELCHDNEQTAIAAWNRRAEPVADDTRRLDALRRCREAIATLDEDALGRDARIGYPYRDELLAEIDAALNEEGSKP